MKKVIAVIIIIATCLLFVVKIFSSYNRNHIMSNQAVFQIYMSMNNEEIDTYFGLEKGTYDNQTQTIICKLPVTTKGFKPDVTLVKFGLDAINCKQEYSPEDFVKYENAELYGHDGTLYILKRSSVSPLMFEERMMRNLIIASKTINVDYKKGKINNIVIEGDKVYDFCDK